MNTRRNNMYIQQTHFIGVTVPDALSQTLEECRTWMHEQYGCRSGYSTPIHITLIPPFHLEESYHEEQLLESVCAAGARCAGQSLFPFTVPVDGFGSFAERTLFAHVCSGGSWEALRNAVYDELLARCPGCVQRDRRPFTPHLTIANRDIPAGAVPEALRHLSELELHTEFSADTIAVFKRQNGRWLIAGTYC
jgi:2'-5' RNA ligase